MGIRAVLRDTLRARGFLWFRRPHLPWGLDLHSDLARIFDLSQFHCVVDVGAHVGSISLNFATYFPNARIYAFEMVPSTFAILQANVEQELRIRPICLGLSDERGEYSISLERDTQLNSLRNRIRVLAPEDNRPRALIELNRLDEVAKDLRIDAIDLLKVDAEGFDLNVLKGADALFENGDVRAVLVEVDFGNSSLDHGNFFEIARWLEERQLAVLGFYDTVLLQRGTTQYLAYTNALFVRS